MDDLPPPLLLDILTRLPDSSVLARCRVASKTLNDLAAEVRAVNLQCSYHRYARSRSSLTRSSVTPFKTILLNLISQLRVIERVSIGVGKPLRLVAYEDVEDEEDDLFLCDTNFLRTWLPKVCGDLASLSISDFWVQSCWRRSDVLSLLSSCCHKLAELEIRNAWLSVDGLTPIPRLTALTLEFVRLDDENMEKINQCFPCLQVLNLIGVGGLKEPKIHLMHLKTCTWTLSNAPLSVSVIAPCLVTLKLKCVKPNLLLIETPLLSNFEFSLESACNIKVKGFSCLNNLHLESTDLRSVLTTLPFGKSVENLTASSLRWEVPVGVSTSIFQLFQHTFPNVSSLTLTSGAWSEFETYPGVQTLESRAQMKKLKEVKAYLTVNDIEATVAAIFTLLDCCSGLSSMAMFIHSDVVSNVTSSLISRCTVRCAQVRWRWGMWKEGMEDTWM